ncbi:MAG: type II secretion system protein GspG [Proteobacteria bacterium]|nr:type II secretion system protein GspG [Pseudomonadota bacterium]
MFEIYREYQEKAKKQNVMRKGMTLIEIMIVLVIMASVMTLVGVNVFGALDSANEKTTKMQLDNFKSGIQQYRLEFKKLPNSLEDLVNTPKGTSLLAEDEVPKDGWDNEFNFEKSGNKIKIFSNGADGMPNTEDDIIVEIK